MKIKGILTDSGGVLNGPVTGHWMITTNFFKIVNREDYFSIDEDRRKSAFRKAMDYINMYPKMESEDEEYFYFREHYRIFFEELPEIEIDEKSIDEITRDLVYNDEKYRFFDDVKEIIPELNKEYKMAVVSDAWPSLKNVFRKADFMKFFDSFVVSYEQGVTKPDPQMYLVALRELDCCEEEVVFVDDRVRNCDGALEVGIRRTYLMCRWKWAYWYRKLTVRRHKVVRDFRMIKKDLEKLNRRESDERITT